MSPELNKIIQGLWIGPELSVMERLSQTHGQGSQEVFVGEIQEDAISPDCLYEKLKQT